MFKRKKKYPNKIVLDDPELEKDVDRDASLFGEIIDSDHNSQNASLVGRQTSLPIDSVSELNEFDVFPDAAQYAQEDYQPTDPYNSYDVYEQPNYNDEYLGQTGIQTLNDPYAPLGYAPQPAYPPMPPLPNLGSYDPYNSNFQNQFPMPNSYNTASFNNPYYAQQNSPYNANFPLANQQFANLQNYQNPYNFQRMPFNPNQPFDIRQTVPFIPPQRQILVPQNVYNPYQNNYQTQTFVPQLPSLPSYGPTQNFAYGQARHNINPNNLPLVDHTAVVDVTQLHPGNPQLSNFSAPTYKQPYDTSFFDNQREVELQEGIMSEITRDKLSNLRFLFNRGDINASEYFQARRETLLDDLKYDSDEESK